MNRTTDTIQLQKQAIDIWLNRSSNPDWREAIHEIMYELANGNTTNLTYQLITDNGWQGPWCSEAEKCEVTFNKAFARIKNRTVGTTENDIREITAASKTTGFMNQEIKKGMGIALEAVPPIPAVIKILERNERSKYTTQFSTWLPISTLTHYVYSLNPYYTLKNIKHTELAEFIKHCPDTKPWRSAARRLLQEDIQSVRRSALIQKYPEAWREARDKSPFQPEESEWIHKPVEEIPDHVICTWTGTRSILICQDKLGNWINVTEENRKRCRRKTDLWAARKFQTQKGTYEFTGTCLKDEMGKPVAWRINNTVGLMDFTQNDPRRLEDQGIEAINFTLIGRPNQIIAQESPQCIEKTIAAAGPCIVAEWAQLEGLARITRITDNPRLQKTGIWVIKMGLELHEKRLLADETAYSRREQIRQYREMCQLVNQIDQYRENRQLLAELL